MNRCVEINPPAGGAVCSRGGGYSRSMVDSALAQTRNCSTLERTLKSIERNRDFRNLADTQDELREYERDVQQAESAYVREGCNAAAKRGEQLSRAMPDPRPPRPQRPARIYEEAQQSVKTGSDIAQQREAVLQEMARFDCSQQILGRRHHPRAQPRQPLRPALRHLRRHR